MGFITCHECNSTNCHKIVTRHEHTYSEDGYSVSKGCCGAILFGPLGVLCGLLGGDRKHHTHVTHDTFWECDNCGLKFKR